MHGNKYYNGNIAVQTWTYGNQLNGYICQYDQLNRYKGAYVILNNAMMDYYYTESFTYDLQGNIKTLERWDQQDMMNDLHFTYNGNQITEITDNGFQPFVYSSKRYHDNSNTDNDFGYDANGNMIYDKDRGISSIRYNVLNLPDTINFENGNRIIHRYTASGKKLTTLYHTYIAHILSPISKNQPTKLQYGTTGTHYIGNIEYLINSDHYMRVNNPEGCVLYLSASDPHLVLTTPDHLGNIRESWVYSMDEPISEGLLQRTQYYPSGLPWNLCTETNFYPYRYNGKEFVEMHGLDEYDSEARWYYPAIMRTTTMDPLCEEYPDISPYAWCGNNPMNNVDPTGMDWYKNEEQQILWTECKNQKELDENQIIGKYLGVAHVVFEGSRDEKLGYKNNEYGYIDGEGAITANVTVYGPRNSDDIHDLIGYTMTSDAEKFGAIDEGLYPANYDVIGKRGNLQSHWVLNNRGAIRMMDGKENPYAQYQKDANGEGYKTGIFIHATNASGKATGNVSAGCLLIAPSDFITFNSIMHNVKQFTVQVSRKVTIYKTNQQNSTSLIPYTYLKID